MKSIMVKIKEYYDENETVSEFCVNDSNEGLFIFRNGSYQQLKGTCDFSANTPQKLIRKIRKMYPFDDVKMVRKSAQGW